MKKLVSLFVGITIFLSSLTFARAEVPSLSYTEQNLDAMRGLIENCENQGLNTDYEKLNYTVLNMFLTYTAEDIANSVGDDRITYNTNYLNNLYTETLNTLNGYLAGTKTPKSKGYTYKTGDYNISGSDIVTASGRPFFSNGFGHDSEAAHALEIFPDLGMNNLQMEFDPKLFVSANDGIPFWKYSRGSTGGTISVDSTEAYEGNKSLKVINPHATQSNVFLTIYQDIPVRPNTTYTLKFYTKGTNVESRDVAGQNPISVCSGSEGWDNRRTFSVGTSWGLSEYSFTTGSSTYQTKIRLNIDNKADAVWIDGFTINEESINNGGFEELASDKQYEITRYNDNTQYMRKILGQAEKNNVSVSVLLSPHYLSSYIKTTFPDAYNTSYGAMGFQINDERVKTLISDYIKESLASISDFKSVSGICVTNEPTFKSYVDSVDYIDEFQTFLRQKHSSITKLNTAWGTSYSAFNKINMPTAWAATPLYYDWMLFNQKVLNTWHEDIANVVRNALKGTNLENVPIYTKVMTSRITNPDKDKQKNFMDGGFDIYDFAGWQNILSFDGWSSYTSSRETKFEGLDILASTENKPLFDSENHFIPDGNDEYVPGHAAHIYNDLWQRAIHGLDASTIWIWARTEDKDSDKYGSILNRPDCLVSAGKATLDLNRVFNIVSDFQKKDKSIALYYSQSSSLYNINNYKGALNDAYKVLTMAGIRCGFVTEDRIEDIDNYDTVIFPQVTNTTAQALTKINSWKEAGGKIIYIGSGCLAKNEYNKTATAPSGTTVTTATLLNEVEDKIEYYAADSNGNMIENVPVEAIEKGGTTYLNICNYNDTEKQVYIKKSDGTAVSNVYDVVEGETRQETILLSAFESQLVRYGEIPGLIPDEINLITQYAQNDASKINISWTNPKTPISCIEVSEPTLGIVSTGKALSLNAGEVNNFWITSGLTEGKIYSFTVSITDYAGNITNYTTTAKPGAYDVAHSQQMSGNVVNSVDYALRPDGSGIFINFFEKYAGNSSLNIKKNNLTQDSQLYLNEVALEIGETYELSFYTKSNLYGGSLNRPYFKWNGGTADYGLFLISPSYNWVKSTYTISGISNNGNGTYSATVTDTNDSSYTLNSLENLNFKALLGVNGAGNVWIDNIELHKIGGNNLYPSDYQFEGNAWGSAYNLINRSNFDSGTTHQIGWNTPTSGTVTVSEVVDENGDTIAAGNTTNSATNLLNIENLTIGELYKHYIKLVVNGNTQYIPMFYTVIGKNESNVYSTNTGYLLSDWTVEGNSARFVSRGTLLTIDSEEKHSGKAALHAIGDSGSNNYGYLKKVFYNLDKNRKYRIGFWAKTASYSGNFQGKIRLHNEGSTQLIADFRADAKDQWKYYETENLAPSSSSNALNMRFYLENLKGQAWIDDIILFEVDDSGNAVNEGENLFSEGGFEYVCQSIRGARVNSDSNSKAITKATISWTNPNCSAITKVYLTDKDGVLVEDDFSTVKNDTVSYLVSGLEPSKMYSYKINVLTSTGDRIEKNVMVNPFGEFMTANYMYEILKCTTLTIDNEVGYSNGTSMKIESDFTTDDGQYGSVEFPVGTDSSKTYKVSFMYKGENVGGRDSVYVRQSATERTGITIHPASVEEWTLGEFTFEGISNGVIQVFVDKTNGTIWFDDIVVREYDTATGKCVGDNLLKNGGFEPCSIDKIHSLNFTEQNGTITAEITKYNSYESDAYLATYDENGMMISVDKVNADSQGELMQSVYPSVNAGNNVAKVKAFVWDRFEPVGISVQR